MASQFPDYDFSALSVYKPFFEEVAEGASSFTISVPRNYSSFTLPNVHGSGSGETQKREFYFSDFHLTPSFYSARAAQLGLDSDPANAQTFSVYFRFLFVVNLEMYSPTQPLELLKEIKFKHALQAYTLDNLLRVVNAYFELKKPEGVIRSPLFFDWAFRPWYKVHGGSTRERSVYDFAKSGVIPDVLAPESLPSFYFDDPPQNEEGEDILDQYLGALEHSLADLKMANHFRFPEKMLSNPTRLELVRIRLNLAPNTTALFSSTGLLEQLGFAEDRRTSGNKIPFINNYTDEYQSFVALNPPRAVNVTPTDNTIILKNSQPSFGTDTRRCTFDAQTFRDNETVFQTLRKEFDVLSDKANLQVSLNYKTEESRFDIVYPQNKYIQTRVICNKECGERLGYGPVTKITQNMFGRPVEAADNVVNAEIKARALAFDTDMIIATLDSSSSSRTHGLEEPLLGTLLPTESGTYNMKFQKAQRSVELPTTGLGGGQFLIPLKVNLWSMKRGSEKMPLDWNVSFTVGGVLEGRVPLRSSSSKRNR